MLHLVYIVLLLSASFNTVTPVVVSWPLWLTAAGISAGSDVGMNGGATAAGGVLSTLKSVVAPMFTDGPLGFTATGISAGSDVGMNGGATAAGGVLSTLKSVVAPMFTAGPLGFTATGKSAGSNVASLISMFAGMNGGATAAGGVVSTLKSVDWSTVAWVAGGAVAPVVAAWPPWLTAAGISAGSDAARMMSMVAGMNGGATAAGSVVTTLRCVDWSRVAWVAGGAVIVVVAAPHVIGALGFTAAGISAGSPAASMMSLFAGMNGGATAAGGVVAILQSAGVVGLTSSATAVVASLGAGVGNAAKSVFCKSSDE
ncbi:interferon alpha-inducible protein 27-like protein 2B isoform X2 [Leucoraja erinacea]|uniref:interferon alpha-inducible protein 27-like protein 2B isoform X2 n=1 Tax=Leucoraja erinaceus TaxID=7782 RepID=UPI0024581732|nr:interferon alpha-inducible protein 27-like protein 2B isoform X2 [Leucoraja erinacea]